MSLAYLHSKPTCEGVIRFEPDDFYVEECLGFEPSGQGEHVWLWVEKKNENTAFIANQLAKAFAVQPRDVSSSGMKDRHAVTRQWFSLPYPIKKPLPKQINITNCTLLKTVRHDRKLKIGTHKANLFKIKLRFDSKLSCNTETELVSFLSQRVDDICKQGVPNYFGEQRFGKQGANIEKAMGLFQGKFKVKDKRKRGIYLSAARSHIFNQVIDYRLKHNVFSPQNGEAFILNGSNSTFTEAALTEESLQRYAQHDILLSACMWGDGALRTEGELQVLESNIAHANAELATGLCNARLKQERRAINLYVPDLKIEFANLDTDPSNEYILAQLSFTLPTGCFATSVLREITQYTDASLNREY